MNKFHIRIIENPDSNMMHLWKRLWNESNFGNFFNTPEWFLVCKKTFTEQEHQILFIESEDEVVGILPLVKEKVFGQTVFTNPGKNYTDKSTLLWNNKYPLSAYFWDNMLKQSNFILSEVSQKYLNSVKGYPGTESAVASVSPYIDLSDPYGNLSKKNLHQILNLIHKNNKKLRFVHERGSLKKHLKEVFQISNNSTKKERGMDILSRKEARLLMENIAEFASEYTGVSILYYENNPVIYDVSFYSKNIYYAYLTAFNKNYSALRPGKLMLYMLLDRLKNEGVSIMDLSRGNNAFKREFTRDYNLQYRLYLSKNKILRFWWQSKDKIKDSLVGNEKIYDTFIYIRKEWQKNI